MQAHNYELLATRAERFVEAGNWREARRDWQAALTIAPDPAAVMLELSYVESLAGLHRDAHAWALRAAEARPNSPEGVHSLVRRLRTFNEVPLLRRLVGRLMVDPQTPANLLVECARQLSNLNDFGLALRCAQAAAARAPEHIAARLVRGQLLAHHGRLDDAASDFDWALARNPDAAIGWWMLARLKKQTRRSNHVVQLQGLLGRPGLAPQNAAALARALHKELDDLNDFPGAWQALEVMCRARGVTDRHDGAAQRKVIDALLAWRPERTSEAHSRVAGRTPVFIVGMHRSGTTLLEQLLSGNHQVRGLGELNDFTSAMRHACDHYCKGTLDLTIIERATRIDFTQVGRHYLASVAWRLGDESCFVDKQPSNFLNLGFICQALPQAKILHMVRDPVETCFSNLRELYSEVNSFSYDQRTLAEYFLKYHDLMRHWRSVYPGRILDVNYARLTGDTEGMMREVAAFCGIRYVAGMANPESCARAVATASSIQVREAVVRRQRPKWAPYARQLRPLIQALREGGIEFDSALA